MHFATSPRERRRTVASVRGRLRRTPDALRGIAWMVVTGLMFVAVTALIRAMGPTLPAPEAAFLRYAIGLVLLGPSIVRLLGHLPERALVGLFVGRGAAHALGVALWFYAMARIPIAEVTAIGYITPILVTLGAALMFGERLKLRRVGGVLAGFAGALVIIRPGFEAVSVGQLAQLGASVFFAASYLLAKRLTAHASPEAIVAMLTLCCTLGLVPLALADWATPTSVAHTS